MFIEAERVSCTIKFPDPKLLSQNTQVHTRAKLTQYQPAHCNLHAINMESQSIGGSDTPLAEVVADMPPSDNSTMHTVSSNIDTQEQAGDSSAPLVSQDVVSTPPSDVIVPQPNSPLLRIAGEVRNMIYDEMMNLGLEDRELFHAMHDLASTCRQLRSEYWSYCLEKTTYRLDLRDYQNFLKLFYPEADEAVMKNYRGKFRANLHYYCAIYTTAIPPLGTSPTVDLRPLIVLLRASPSIEFSVNREVQWMCNALDLENFIKYARTSETWAATSIVEAVKLRTQQAVMDRQRNAPKYWIIDVHLKRSLQQFYTDTGLMAYLEERSTMRHDGIVFCMAWDKPDPAIEPKKVGWFRSLKDHIVGGLGKLVPNALKRKH